MVDPERVNLPISKIGIEQEEIDPLAGDPFYEFFRAHERAYERLGEELRTEGYLIDQLQDTGTMLIQISGRLPTGEMFFFHGRRSTLSLSVGKPDAVEQDIEDKWMAWNKHKFLDKDGNAQDTFELGDDEEDEDEDWEPDAEVTDLMPAEVIDIFRQLVLEYKQDTSIEGEFREIPN